LNYLGHAVFSPKDDEITLGNLAGDMLKNRFHPLLEEKVLRGVRLHRFIDTTTDNNVHFRRMIQCFRPHFSKYSPVILDVFIDHLIALHWEDLFEDSYSGYLNSIYKGILDQSDQLPQPAQNNISRMAQSQWLDVYKSREGLIRVFNRLSQKVVPTLEGERVLDIYHRNRGLIDSEFNFFINEMRQLLQEDELGLSNPRIKWKS
jgi:acyl carrier protein phosphodiesterase